MLNTAFVFDIDLGSTRIEVDHWTALLSVESCYFCIFLDKRHFWKSFSAALLQFVLSRTNTFLYRTVVF